MSNRSAMKYARGFTLIETLFVLVIALTAISLVAIYAKRAHDDSQVAALVADVAQMQNNIRTAYQGQSSYNSITFPNLLSMDIIPPDLQIAGVTTYGQSPWGLFGVSPGMYPSLPSGQISNWGDTVRLTIFVNSQTACNAIAIALAPSSLYMNILPSGLVIAPVVVAGTPRDNGAILAAAQTACAGVGNRRLVYYFQ